MSRNPRYLVAAAVVLAVVVAGAVGPTLPGGPDPGATTTTGPEWRPPEWPALGSNATNATDDRVPVRFAFQRPHRAGVTGEGVSIGVVDVTGFDPNYPGIAPNVESTQSFGRGNDITNGGYDDHGTAAAEIAVTAAPDADLYLANFDSPAGYTRALRWMQRQDVDVVVAPVTVYGSPGDGTDPTARASTRAVDDGVVVVAPTGNLARGHWRGRYRPDEGGTHVFSEGDRRLSLSGDGDRLSVWLSWDRAHRETDFTLAVYREGPDGPVLVATSKPYRVDGVPNERVVLTDDGEYSLAIWGPENATNAELELATPTHRLERTMPNGSIAAPATGTGVLAVGAYDRRNRTVADFSSRGPTSDGRRGVDVVAPGRIWTSGDDPLVGSSAAAPYVGGVAALLLQRDPTLTPATLEAHLEATATDVGRPGPDPVAGSGRVRPWAAVQSVGESAGTTDGSRAATNGTTSVP